MDLRFHELEWTILKVVIFKHDLQTGFGEEDFLITRRKKSKKIRLQIGVLFIGETPYSEKKLRLSFGDRKVGVLGTGVKSKLMAVKCPYCKKIQKMKEDPQDCEGCKKSFYLFGDNW